MVVGLRHVGIVVNDLFENKKFFIELLNFSILSEKLEYGDNLSQILNIDNVVVKTVKLKNEIGSVIELLKFKNPSHKKSDNQKSLTDHGLTHIAIEVKDINLIYARLKDANFQTLSEPTLSDDKMATLFLDGNLFIFRWQHFFYI